MRPFAISIVGINPEPWKAPTSSMGRKGGKHRIVTSKAQNVITYQMAVREAVADALARTPVEGLPIPKDVNFHMDVYFWRQLEQYRTESGQLRRRQRADRANLLKALEDCLQGMGRGESAAPPLLYENDRSIVGGEVCVVEQWQETEPRILIVLRDIEPYFPWGTLDVPSIHDEHHAVLVEL